MGGQIAELAHDNFVIECVNSVPAVWMTLFSEEDIQWEDHLGTLYPYLKVNAQIGIQRSEERRDIFLKQIPTFFVEYYDAWLNYIRRFPYGTFEFNPCWFLSVFLSDTKEMELEIRKCLRAFELDDPWHWNELFSYSQEPLSPESEEEYRQNLYAFEEAIYNMFGTGSYLFDLEDGTLPDWDQLFLSRYGRCLLDWREVDLSKKVPI